MSQVWLVLKPSPIDGVGVFAVEPIQKGMVLPLYPAEEEYRTLTQSQVYELPLSVMNFVYVDGSEIVFPDVHHLCIGHYLNHAEEANVFYRQEDDSYVAVKDICAEEELTINYRITYEESRDMLVKEASTVRRVRTEEEFQRIRKEHPDCGIANWGIQVHKYRNMSIHYAHCSVLGKRHHVEHQSHGNRYIKLVANTVEELFRVYPKVWGCQKCGTDRFSLIKR